jgi:dehydrogenase/reductase SDR family protein 4
MKKFAGKVAIVTGSTQGIGFSIARRLGLDGARVLISSRKQANVDEAVQKLRNEKVDVDGMVCHVGKAKDRESLVNTTLQKYGRIDILINNAGINPHFGNLLDVNENTWDKIFDTNVKAGFLLSQLVIPHMEKQGGGNIVFNSSITGYVPFQGIAAYSVSKTAVIGLVKALAITVGHMNIRVNGIAPGIVKTEFSKALWEDEDTQKFQTDNIPLGRMAKPDDCSGAVSFLCSDDSNYITGEVMMITGGINARL